MMASLLHYRPWNGRLHAAELSVWPIARTALAMIFRRRLFWVLYAFGLMIFFMFFFGQYLLAWAVSQLAEQTVRVGIIRAEPERLVHLLREVLRLDGSAYTYRNFFWYQGYMVMIVLAFTGSVLVGNDFHFGSLPFYLAKPLGRWHYLLGKCLAVGVFVNLMTTLPALILFVQYGLIDPDAESTFSYFISSRWLFLGILGYGVLLTVCLSLMLVAAATWLRGTVPLIMTWTTFFFFLRLLAISLVDGFHYDPRLRLIDLWNNTYLVGNWCLGNEVIRTPQPPIYLAGLVVAAVSLLCLIYLNRRIRAVEIVR
jgi:ABC-type transport system involved in multi-copper enzyme maturation permease subunit